MKNKLDFNKLLLVVSILVFLDALIQASYFHMSWKNDTITNIISFVGNFNFLLLLFILLLFIYSVYSLFKNKTYLLFIINSLSLIIMLTT